MLALSFYFSSRGMEQMTTVTTSASTLLIMLFFFVEGKGQGKVEDLYIERESLLRLN